MPLSSIPRATRILLILAVICLGILAVVIFRKGALPPPPRISSISTFPAYPAARSESLPTVNAADFASTSPLFFSDRKPHVVLLEAIDGAGDVATAPFDAILTGIVRSNSLNMASLQMMGQPLPIHVRLGDEVPNASGWRLVDLAPKSARFRSNNDETILKLDNRGPNGAGQAPAPTPTAAPKPMSALQPGDSGTGTPLGSAMPTPQQNVPMPPAQSTPSSTLTQKQQMDAIRKRIEAAQKALHQPAPAAGP